MMLRKFEAASILSWSAIAYVRNILLTVFVVMNFSLPVLASSSRSPASGFLDEISRDAGEDDSRSNPRMEWFKNAKFGLFIHWGPYSRLAGEWKGRKVGNHRNSEWIMNFLEIPRDEYRAQAREFNPVEFNAREWVLLARKAGMKYLVLTAKHHDGFAMYDSDVSEYNILDWTAFDRDPLRDLAEECRSAGIRFGFYYSQREDWDEPFAYGNTWDFDFKPESNLRRFEQEYLETKVKPQLRELLTEYGPIDLIWFDRGLYTQEQARDLRDLVSGLQPECLVNGRIGNYGSELMGDFQDLNDNGMPASGIEEYWETPQTLNDTWGYSRYDHNWKKPAEIITRLVEIVSKGGNYLLNVGPDGLGRIPQPSRKVLLEAGKWLDSYGESIYGTQSSPFPSCEWGFVTRKDGVLYLHLTGWPDLGILPVTGLLNREIKATPLLQPSRVLPVSLAGKYPEIDLAGVERDDYVSVIKVELKGEPEVEEQVVNHGDDGSFLLDFASAVTTGSVLKRFNRKGGYHFSGWSTPGDRVSWNLRLDESGSFRILASYAALPAWRGQEFVLTVDGCAIEAETSGTGSWYEYQTFDLGIVNLGSPGSKVLEFGPKGTVRDMLMYLREIRLEPVRD